LAHVRITLGGRAASSPTPGDEEIGRNYAPSAGDILLTEGGDTDKLGRGAVSRGTFATSHSSESRHFATVVPRSKANQITGL
jgi:hypothetical protein